jgi:biopolymer transport protein ExbB
MNAGAVAASGATASFFLNTRRLPLFAIIQAAGWPIWFLIIASVVAVALIIERFVALQKPKILPPGLLSDVVKLHRGNQVSSEVLAKLEANSPLGRVLAAGLRHVNSPREVMKTAIEETGSHVAHDLSRFLNTLGTIASAAPLMGLFGTVVGMIEIFGASGSGSGGANVQQIAHGISVALYNTGLGILIAIPALIFYRYFRGKVDDFVVQMEQQAVRFVDVVHGDRK